jgi:hypothetical protein
MLSQVIFAKVKTKAARWIAIAAVLLATFAPTISNTIAAESKASWQEICSIQGIKYIPAVSGALSKAADSQPAEDGRMLHMEHCPYCFMHAGSVGIIQATGPLFIAVDSSQNSPQLYTFSPQTALPWAASRSRAPPSFS